MSLQAEIGRLRPSLTVVVCFCIAGLEGFDIQAFGVTAPQLASDLHLSPGQMGWAGSAAMIGLALGALLGGGLADRWGRRPILAGSVALFGLFSLGTAMAETYHILLAARFLTGLGFGGAMPNLIAIATEISSPNRRAATTTSMFCGLPTGGALVALIAKAGGAGLDWRILFLIGGAAPLILAPMVMRLLPETQSRSEKLAPRSVATSLFGAATRTSTLLIWLVLVLDLLVTYLLLNWLPTLVVAKGYASADGADAAVWFNGFSILGALILGQAADRLGFRAPVTLGFIGLAFGLYGLANAASLPAILAFSALSGFLATRAASMK